MFIFQKKNVNVEKSVKQVSSYISILIRIKYKNNLEIIRNNC